MVEVCFVCGIEVFDNPVLLLVGVYYGVVSGNGSIGQEDLAVLLSAYVDGAAFEVEFVYGSAGLFYDNVHCF